MKISPKTSTLVQTEALICRPELRRWKTTVPMDFWLALELQMGVERETAEPRLDVLLQQYSCEQNPEAEEASVLAAEAHHSDLRALPECHVMMTLLGLQAMVAAPSPESQYEKTVTMQKKKTANKIAMDAPCRLHASDASS